MTERPAPADRRSLVPARWVTIAVTALIVVASILYAAGVPWVRTGLDDFWTWFDGNLERLRALVPLVLAYIAFRVYRSDRWWHRAQWALDAASEGRPHTRRRFGDRAIDELLVSKMAPTQDFTMFSTVVADRVGELLRDEIDEDPTLAETSHPETGGEDDPDVDATAGRRGQ